MRATGSMTPTTKEPPTAVNRNTSQTYFARPHATTILGVKRDDQIALAGDGQVTIGDVVLKQGARKIRTLYDGQVLAGFAGAVADALTLFAKFETQLQSWDGNLRRAAVELTKEWRSDRFLRRLEAQLIVADAESLLLLSGEGDVIEPDDGIVAIGAGAPYATAAAKALVRNTDLNARDIVLRAMEITAEICIFTNEFLTIETVGAVESDTFDSVDDLPLEPVADAQSRPGSADGAADEEEGR